VLVSACVHVHSVSGTRPSPARYRVVSFSSQLLREFSTAVTISLNKAGSLSQRAVGRGPGPLGGGQFPCMSGGFAAGWGGPVSSDCHLGQAPSVYRLLAGVVWLVAPPASPKPAAEGWVPLGPHTALASPPCSKLLR
jgi:hypothetical protein